MLRFLREEESPTVAPDPRVAETVRAIERFVRAAHDQAAASAGDAAQAKKFALWAEGLLRSYRELEESRRAARHFAERIAGTRPEDRTEEQRLDYDRHVYFDKNAYIRVFAILDKLGSLLNELLELRTERIKPRFSYFTVLRNMRQHRLHPALSGPLGELKDRHQDAMSRLRTRRNLEIHYMNAELYDDWRYRAVWETQSREDIAANMADLDEGCRMVSQSLALSMTYGVQRLDGIKAAGERFTKANAPGRPGEGCEVAFGKEPDA